MRPRQEQRIVTPGDPEVVKQHHPRSIRKRKTVEPRRTNQQARLTPAQQT